MLLRPFLSIIMLVAITGCSSEQNKAQEAFRADMKDPDSAQFRNFKMKGNKACVEVNGKNAYGGYTGFQTAFLKKDDKGQWTGWSSGDIGYDYCVKDLAKPE